MDIRLLFITNSYFYQPTLQALARLNPSCDTQVVVYNSFDEIISVYDRYAPSFDGVFISGSSAKHIIDSHYPDNKKPITSFQVDSDALHRDILRFAIETQNLDFSRIAVDFLLPLGDSCSVVDFLALDSMEPVIRQNARLTESADADPGLPLEQIILNQVISLWDQGAIDMVLCLYASIVPTLQEHGIPFRCPFISDGHLNRLIREMLVKIELTSLHNNHPAILQIFPRQSTPETARHIGQISGLMRSFMQTNMIDCVIQESNQCCIIIATMQILRFLTNDFQECTISAWLESRTGLPVVVGCGIGTTVPHAMNNVQLASKEAKILGKSFIVDSNGNLIGPLSSANHMVITPSSQPDVSDIARRCSLSSMTIHRILALVRGTGSDKITTQELASRLGTSLRNANRIMQNLCQGNVAKPVYTQSSHSRGRPIQVYSLDFGSTNP